MGIVQGLTEYLPVSSSAHLVIMPKLFGFSLPEHEAFIFDVLVQLGTLIGVFAYFWQKLFSIAQSALTGLAKGTPLHDENARLGWLVVLATIPAAVLGLIFKKPLAATFSDPLFACYFLIVTGILLILAEYVGKHLRNSVTMNDAVMIGVAQGLALLPGVSRSGSTISMGMMRGLSRTSAAQFSFIMSIPAMFGAAFVASFDLLNDASLIKSMLTPLLIGFISAAVTGYLVIKWFMAFVSHQRLYIFALYCFLAGGIGAYYFSF